MPAMTQGSADPDQICALPKSESHYLYQSHWNKPANIQKLEKIHFSRLGVQHWRISLAPRKEGRLCDDCWNGMCTGCDLSELFLHSRKERRFRNGCTHILYFHDERPPSPQHPDVAILPACVQNQCLALHRCLSIIAMCRLAFGKHWPRPCQPALAAGLVAAKQGSNTIFGRVCPQLHFQVLRAESPGSLSQKLEPASNLQTGQR